ncbi:hypothetical protein C0991_012544 [Blastosporella zonata]|nr:hypothetical protein C0991_012544 [Blastosporella zonata]
MSLRPATKDISNHPAAGSVVDPVNKEEQDKDVDRKLRIYGAITALRHGRLPTNRQINKICDYLLDHSVKTERLSPDGKKVVHDMQQIIKTTRRMVHEKNGDELLQQFMWHTRDVEVDREGLKGEGTTVAAATGEQEKAETENQEGTFADYLTTITMTDITTPQPSATSARSSPSSSPTLKSASSSPTSTS